MRRQISQRWFVRGRIEYQQATEALVLNDGRSLRLVIYFDGDNAMIELLRRRPLRTHIIRIAGIDTYGERSDTQNLQHRAHQIRFVFTVAVRLGEDLRVHVPTIPTPSSQPVFDPTVPHLLN